MIHEGGGCFHLVGEAPVWFDEFCRPGASGYLSVSPVDLFPVLRAFIQQAELFWADQQRGRLRSGVWVQPLSDGTEVMLEASAVLYGQAKMLTIEPVVADSAGTLAAHDEKECLSGEAGTSSPSPFQHQQKQKMEAIGTLASGIAHDFNNILSAIIGYVEIVRLDLNQSSGASRNLSQVLAAANRAKSLVQQILAFSRRDETVVQSVNIEPVVTEALTLIRAGLPSSVQIKSYLDSQSFVRCDPTQIHQICINLLANAAQAMGDDGGVMELHLADVTLDETSVETLSDVSPGSYVRLTVIDNGGGIPDLILNRIFDPFFTTKPKGRGTGMGLAVIHGIVTAAGGAVTVKNRMHGGCRFDVFLPVCSGSTTSPQSVQAAMPTGNESVLFVDDETIQTDVASQLLTRLGYDVTASTSSVDALSIFERDPSAWDLVVTDMAMPVISGRTLAKRMHSLRPDMPIILCSGLSSSVSESAACEMGFAAYLKKPLLSNDMAITIRQVLDKPLQKAGTI